MKPTSALRCVTAKSGRVARCDAWSRRPARPRRAGARKAPPGPRPDRRSACEADPPARPPPPGWRGAVSLPPQKRRQPPQDRAPRSRPAPHSFMNRPHYSAHAAHNQGHASYLLRWKPPADQCRAARAACTLRAGCPGVRPAGSDRRGGAITPRRRWGRRPGRAARRPRCAEPRARRRCACRGAARSRRGRPPPPGCGPRCRPPAAAPPGSPGG